MGKLLVWYSFYESYAKLWAASIVCAGMHLLQVKGALAS